ncbi:AI-2E family transporter, partial [Oleiphilus sp. HI0123]
MLQVLRSWVDRYFSDEEAVVLLILIGGSLVFISLWGDIMAPVIASVILAYVLQGFIAYLVSKGMNNKAAIYSSYILFLGVVFGFIFSVMPLVWRQLSSLVGDAPNILNNLKSHIFTLQEDYSHIITISEL